MNKVEKRVQDTAETIGKDIIKVDHFLNHYMDVIFLEDIASLFYDAFKHLEINKILTCEASGIGIAVVVAQKFKVDLVFAKKRTLDYINPSDYKAEVFSYTKQYSTLFTVNQRYLLPTDRLLIIDDFLANGEAMRGLIDIVKQAKASVSGIGVVIEKGFQPGGQWLREQGYLLNSLCIVDDVVNGQITIREQ